MQQRYYDPIIGRFYSNDPIGFISSNPMMFNRYAYANYNPYKYIDPDGEFSISINPNDTAKYQSMGQMQQAQRQIQQVQSYANDKMAPAEQAGVVLGGIGAADSVGLSMTGALAPPGALGLLLSLDGIRFSWTGNQTLSGMGLKTVATYVGLERKNIARASNLSDFVQNTAGGGMQSRHKTVTKAGNVSDAAGAVSQINDAANRASGLPVVEIESIRLNEIEKKRE